MPVERRVSDRSSVPLQLDGNSTLVYGEQEIHSLIPAGGCGLYVVALLIEDVGHEILKLNAAHVMDAFSESIPFKQSFYLLCSLLFFPPALFLQLLTQLLTHLAPIFFHL